MFRTLFSVSCIIAALSCSAQTTLPDRMYADSAYAPFLWGVASGDPLTDGVVIWTKVQESIIPMVQTQTWEVSADSSFAITVATGSVDALTTNDHCVRVMVTGLQPDTYYYYRFTDSASGNTSRIGRTKTAPIGPTDEFTVAVSSCSSVYSGYFNAYRNIANNDEVDLMVHLGDYIYNFVDGDEEFRVPDPYPADPENLEEWRDRHEYYLLDPDLRKLRQMHPWVVIWDNHDFADGTEGGVQAFWEYVPRRDQQNDTTLIHRSYSYGDLLDLIMIDIEKHRDIDTLASGELSVLGTEQRGWFLNQLSNSTAKWRLVGNQKMFGGWYSEGIPAWLPIPNDGNVFDAGSWDGYMSEREMVLQHLIDNGIDNIMIFSGDVHMSFCMDVSLDPRNGSVYDPETGSGAVATEFIPTSVSRGNFDESGVPFELQTIVQEISNGINPHHRFVNFYDHGYGLLNITPDSIAAEIRYCDKLVVTDDETLGVRMLMMDGENRWHRPGSEPESVMESGSTQSIKIFPNPAQNSISVSVSNQITGDLRASLLNSMGQTVHSIPSAGSRFNIDLSEFADGNYLLLIETSKNVFRKSFIIAR